MNLSVCILTAVFLNTSLMEATVRLTTKSVCAPIPLFADTLLILEKVDIFINVLVPYGVTIVFTIVSAYRVGKKKIYKRRHGVTGYNSETSIKHECHLLYFTLMALIAIIVLPCASIKTYHVIRTVFTFDKPLTMREGLLQEMLTLISSTKCCMHIFYLSFCSKSFRTCVVLFTQRLSGLLCSWCSKQSRSVSVSVMDNPEELSDMLQDYRSKNSSQNGSRSGKKLAVTACAETSKFSLQAREAAVV